MDYRQLPGSTAPLIAAFNGRIFGLEREDGSVRWDNRLSTTGFPVHFDIAHGRIYAGVHNELFCVDLDGGELFWKVKLRFVGVTRVMVDGERIYVASSGELECVGITGEPLWANGFEGKGYGVIALGLPDRLGRADEGA